MYFLRGAEEQNEPQNNNNMNQILYIVIELIAIVIICLLYCVCVSLNITLIDHLQMRNMNASNMMRNWSYSSLRPTPNCSTESYMKVDIDDKDMDCAIRPRANTII
jgi:ABC-type phosphate transport system permease subunit